MKDEMKDLQKEYNEEMKSISNSASFDEEDIEYSLIVGYKDSEGNIHKTFTVREITGEDEEFINRADLRSNGAKVTTALLSRCVKSIGTLTRKSVGNPKEWENVFKQMTTADRDIILLQIRKQSIGEEIEVTHECPYCKAKLKTTVDVDELNIVPFNGLVEIPFELIKGYKDKKGVVHKTGKMRRPNGLDGELLTVTAKKNLAKAETLLLTRVCKFDDGTYIDESVMTSLTLRDRKYLQEVLNDNRAGVDLTVEVTCDQCGETFEGNLNQSNFI